MTKTLDKILNGIKKAAVVTGIAASSILGYNSNANAQETKFVAGQTVKVQDPNGNVIEAPVLNIQGTYYFEVREEAKGNSDEKPESKLWVSYTCPRQYSYGSDESTYTKGIVLERKDARFKDSDGETRVGELKLNKKGFLAIDGPKMEELIKQERSNLSVTELHDKGRVTGIKTIEIEDNDHFVPYMNEGIMDSLVLDVDKKYVANFISLPVRDENGVYTDQIILPTGQVSLGNYADGSIYVVDTTESLKEYLQADSLKKFLRPSNFPSEEYVLQKTGEVSGFGKWKEKAESDEQKKKKSDGNGLGMIVRPEVGYSIFGMKGPEGRLMIAMPIGETGVNAGFYGEGFLQSKESDDITNLPDSIGKLPNVNIYLKKDNVSIGDHRILTPVWGAGISADYSLEGSPLEMAVRAGIVSEKMQQDITTSGRISLLDGTQTNVLSSSDTSYVDSYSFDAISPKVSLAINYFPFKNAEKGPKGLYVGANGSMTFSQLKDVDAQKIKPYGSVGAVVGWKFYQNKAHSNKKSKKSKN